jgi:hypothetical protein
MRIKWCLQEEEQRAKHLQDLQNDVVEVNEDKDTDSSDGEENDIDDVVYFDEQETYTESELMELVGLN